jgi:uncharacterized phage protein (TIGR01671 family)
MRKNIGLFRGKCAGQWLYGYLTIDGNGTCQIWENTDVGFFPAVVNPKTVSEYTGLTDKNGVKIFEGDILESFYKDKQIVSVVKYGGFEPEFFYECAEAQGFFLHGMKLYGLYAYDLAGSEMMFVEDMRQAKIIGNIHDNPELLGGDDHAAD